MRLFWSPTSPFVRKVSICAHLRGLQARIQHIPTDPWSQPAELLARNPLSMIPCLITEDGLSLFDSNVICEYLDSLGDAAPLFPRTGEGARWQALKQQAVADGLMNAAIRRRMEMPNPPDDARTATLHAQAGKVTRALALLEEEPPPAEWHIGAITIACALGYLDFRFSTEDWRQAHPRLASWYDARQELPELQQTAPA